MAENTRIVREQRRLETNVKVPPVDAFLYVCALRSRNIPYDTWQRQLKPYIPTIQSSLQTNHKVNTLNI